MQKNKWSHTMIDLEKSDKLQRYSRHKSRTINPRLRDAVRQGAWQQAMPHAQQIAT